ncbi:hypothetical protein [Streptomyces antibioticus]|uniref:Lipoprotein n=1 Tax=Streptomyces antibioticus TaxID=1890 RepID=A0AAE7CIM6_STRAT|nr:hypothetical protein [Streptomyces antibioticus]OOQ54723.1 hypothetical protein AFM16_01345 [Streptomyces antibioticus]QIT42364.1 hypothetical protein HCX60_01510 [Streptomyces antibioticus]
MQTRTRTHAAVTTTLLLVALTACSSSDGGTPADSEPTISVPAEHQGDDLEAAVAVYTASYFAGDADTAYGMLSARCAEETTKDAYTAVVKQAAADHGADHPLTDLRAEVSGTTGHATYKVTGLPEFDKKAQPWTLEDGAWKYDDC